MTLNNISTSKKLILTFGVMGVLLLITAATAWWGLAALNKSVGTVITQSAKLKKCTDISADLDGIYLKMWDLTTTQTSEDRQAALAEITKLRADYRKKLDDLKAQAVTPEGRELLAHLEEIAITASQNNQKLAGIVLKSDGKDAKALEQFSTVGKKENEEKLHPAIEAIVAHREKLIRMTDSDAEGAFRQAKWVLGCCIIVSLVLASLLGFAIWRSLVQPLKACLDINNRLAAGDFSTSIPKEICRRKDEFGALALAIDNSASTFRNILREISSNAQELTDTARMFGDTSRTQSEEAKESALETNAVATAGEQLAANSRNMTDSTKHINDSATTVSASVEEMAASINEVSKNCAREAEIANQAAKQADKTKEQMNRMAEAAQKIDKIVEMISRIAQQTNLLALNATIEAASAGEAGRGFAVVANEVKELARQSATATEDIRSQIGSIQTAAAESKKAIDDVVFVIDQVNQIAVSIASAVEEQSATSSEISRSLHEIKISTDELTSNVTESSVGAAEISRTIQAVSNSIKCTAGGAVRQEVSAKGLLYISESMQAVVGRFKLEMEESESGKTAEEKDLSSAIKKAVVAHGAWKQRLRTAIATGKSTFVVDTVRKDDCCDFGKWIYGCQEGHKKSPHWQCVREEHAKFHQEAAKVLQEAIGGDPAVATEFLVNPTSTFRQACTKLAAALDAWVA